MKKTFKLILLFFFLSGFFSCSVYNNGQKVTVYKNLEEALKIPNEVLFLKLTRKKYSKFPMDILKFKNLKSLDLSKNKLDSIPAEISQLSNLEELKLNNNKFMFFPVEICELNSLKKLGLNNNDLENIPKEIANLDNLVYLDLWSNLIIDFPEELKQLVKLKRLDLRLIEISDEKQYELRQMLPKVKIFMSNSCNCGS